MPPAPSTHTASYAALQGRFANRGIAVARRDNDVSSHSPARPAQSVVRPSDAPDLRQLRAAMLPPDTPKPDSDIRALAESGKLREAATTLIERHGPGVLGYLHALSSSPAESEELFADVCERLWKRIDDFDWTGSARTWMYVTARNRLIDTRRRQRVRPHVPLSSARELAAAVCSSTAVYRKTEVKDQLHRLRAELEPDDRTLLILRVDRSMTWDEVARVMEGAPSEQELKRAASRLRKRFERLKLRIREALVTPLEA